MTKPLKWYLWRVCVYLLLLTKKTGFSRWELSLSFRVFYENGYTPLKAWKECMTYNEG